MNTLHGLSMALWQANDSSLTARDEHLLMICIALIAGAMVVQALVTLGAAFVARKTMMELKDLAHDLHTKVYRSCRRRLR